jgi:methyl-accepting chemotaxis protein
MRPRRRAEEIMMNRLSISARIVVLAGVLALLLAVVGVFGLLAVSRSNEALRSVYEDSISPMARIAAIEDRLVHSQLTVLRTLADTSGDGLIDALLSVENSTKEVDKHWAAYMATALSARETEAAQKFAEHRQRFARDAMTPLLAALRRNGDPAVTQRLMSEMFVPLYQPVSDGIRRLRDMQVEEANAQYEAALARFAQQRGLWIALVGGGLLLSVIFSAMLVRSIRSSLRVAVEVAEAVASGDLARTIPAGGADEVGDLLKSMTTMRDSLVHLVGEVRRNCDSVATASIEIAQGNLDLSVRTEHQATAVQQTASSMQALGSTVTHSAENARQAEQLARQAHTVAQSSGAVMGEVVGTMQGISESARRISEIIAVVDGLAFQTNILALNAAVEAARAGEQGRGFAVVAAEVRSLAQRSAGAAREIKTLA